MTVGKHTPYTSETSDPHRSKTEPREHVDQIHYGKEGKRRKDLDVNHITDPGMVELGRKSKEFREQKKREKEQKEKAERGKKGEKRKK